jgi:adenylate cyclase
MKIKNFLVNFRFHRKIQVHLLTIFLLLLSSTVFFITRFTYEKYYKSINDLSNYMIDQTNILLLEQVKNLKENVELTTEFIKGSLHTKAEITGQDPDYVQFLVNILRKDSVLTELMIGTPEGDYLAVVNIRLATGRHFYTRPEEKLPERSSYILRTVIRKGESSQEEWSYLDEEGKIIATEFVIPTSADFQKNDWILRMIKNPSPFWSNELLPREVDEARFKKTYSVTLSDVLKNSYGEVIAILSVGVTLQTLSDFIKQQKIGKNGFAFIVNGQGHITVPLSYQQLNALSYKKILIEHGYREFQKTQQQSFILKQDKEKYLFSIKNCSIFQTDPWFLAIVVPFDDFFGDIVKTQKTTMWMSLVIFLISGMITYFCVRNITRPIVRLVTEVDKIRNFDFTEQKNRLSHIQEIFDLESSINAMRSALHSFGRYIPKEIVRTLIKYGRDVTLGGERSEITMMFSDIENFTTISESLPIQDLMSLLSEYFDVISKIILQEGGIIDKYIGDSVMSFWGAPVKIRNPAEKACLAALKALAFIVHQKKWTTRFGIHTGEVIVGNIGTSERINYTIIGDAVNVASRLQSINKEYHTSIIISENVHQQIEGQFVTRPLDFVAVRGKKSKMRIFELMGTKEGELAASPERLEMAKLFTYAYERVEIGALEEALDCFLSIEKKFPFDVPTKKYIERLRR